MYIVEYNLEFDNSIDPCKRFCLPKGQTKSKRFFQAVVSSNKRKNEFYFATMKHQVDMFSFVFWRKLKKQKRHFEIN